jgi:hypothetical protein
MTALNHVFEKFLDSLPSSPLYHDDDYKTKAAVLLVAAYLVYGFLLGVYRSMCVHKRLTLPHLG